MFYMCLHVCIKCLITFIQEKIRENGILNKEKLLKFYEKICKPKKFIFYLNDN